MHGVRRSIIALSHDVRRAAFALGAVALLGAAAGCASGLPVPNAADVTRPGSPLARTSTLNDLQAGRELYRSRCGSCHALRDPMSLPPASWVTQVRDMQDKKGVRLSPEEARQITAYLVAISSR